MSSAKGSNNLICDFSNNAFPLRQQTIERVLHVNQTHALTTHSIGSFAVIYIVTWISR